MECVGVLSYAMNMIGLKAWAHMQGCVAGRAQSQGEMPGGEVMAMFSSLSMSLSLFVVIAE